jgi:hypothetical protein
VEIITKKHWIGWNSDDKTESDWAFRSSNENFNAYAERLEKLRPELKERNYRFFKNSLHDGRLVSFSVGDGLHIDFEKVTPSIADFYKTAVAVKVLNAEFDFLYDLKFGNVSKCVFDFPSDEPLWGANIDDWGYDEISKLDEKLFRYEILFSSGATALIEFEKFSYKRSKVDAGRYKKQVVR